MAGTIENIDNCTAFLSPRLVSLFWISTLYELLCLGAIPVDESDYRVFLFPIFDN